MNWSTDVNILSETSPKMPVLQILTKRSRIYYFPGKEIFLEGDITETYTTKDKNHYEPRTFLIVSDNSEIVKGF